ncbi:hypothetical protein AcW1_003870 [Taiwanofungus camphoratus]|nr:hypothetical protein AcW1_003870 [Antrodia cinnamomea]
MSSTLSVQKSLYLMANRVHLALSDLPGPNHSCRTWFEERLEQELHPLQNLLIMASTASEWPYVPAIILSSTAEDPEVKANPWYLEPPEGAVSEVREESMEDTWWQADAVAGAKRTRETSVEVEVEEETQRRKKRVEVDGVSWEEGMVEEDIEMEGMSPVERGQRHEEKKLAQQPATASPLPCLLPRTPCKLKGILKPTTPVPSEDEWGQLLRRSSQAQSRSRSVSAVLSKQGRPSRRLGAMCSDEWAWPMDPPCTWCEPGECIISTHLNQPPTDKVTACDRCHFAKAKCMQSPPTTHHHQATAKVADATVSFSWPSTGKKTGRAQAMEPVGQRTPAPKTGKMAVSRRRSPSPVDEPSESGGEGTVASMPPKRRNIVVPPAWRLHVPRLSDTLVQPWDVPAEDLGGQVELLEYENLALHRQLAAMELMVETLRAAVEGLVGPGVLNLPGPSTGPQEEVPMDHNSGLMDWEISRGDLAPSQDDLAPLKDDLALPQNDPALPQENPALALYITAPDASDPAMVHLNTGLHDQEQEPVVWFSLPDMERRVSRVYSPPVINLAPSVLPTPSPASPVPLPDALALLLQDLALVHPLAVLIIYYPALVSGDRVPVIYPEVQGPGETPAATSACAQPQSQVMEVSTGKGGDGVSAMLSGYGDEEDEDDVMDIE